MTFLNNKQALLDRTKSEIKNLSAFNIFNGLGTPCSILRWSTPKTVILKRLKGGFGIKFNQVYKDIRKTER